MMTSSNGNIFRVTGLCAGNSPVTGEFPAQRPVTRSFDVFFDLRPNKRLSKQSWDWWFGTPSRPLWGHCNEEKNIEQARWKTIVIWSVLSLLIIASSYSACNIQNCTLLFPLVYVQCIISCRHTAMMSIVFLSLYRVMLRGFVFFFYPYSSGLLHWHLALPWRHNERYGVSNQ